MLLIWLIKNSYILLYIFIAVNLNVENALEKDTSETKKKSNKELQYELSTNLASYMTTDVNYTVKRLLPADLKILYNKAKEDIIYPDINPNPFDENFSCFIDEKKGGVWLTDHIMFQRYVYF